MAVENLTKDFYGRPLFRAFVREEDGSIRWDYSEVEIQGHRYRLYAQKGVSEVERIKEFARLSGRHKGRIYKVGRLFILIIADSDEQASYGVEFVVEEDGKVVASFELFDYEYLLLLEGEELGREILMLLQAGWRVEF